MNEVKEIRFDDLMDRVKRVDQSPVRLRMKRPFALLIEGRQLRFADTSEIVPAVEKLGYKVTYQGGE